MTTTRKKKAEPASAVEQPIVHSIKGFNQDLTCRGYQFAVGQTYTHEGPIRACSSGWHACTVDAHPFAVFGYYAPAGSRFFEVQQGGDTHSDDGIKIATRSESILPSLKRTIKALPVTQQIDLLLVILRGKDLFNLDGDELDRADVALCSLLSESRERDHYQDRALHGAEVAA